MMDAFTVSDHYPYSRAYRVEDARVNYVRNSVKAVDRRLRRDDDVLRLRRRGSDHRRLSRGCFPTLFKDASAMPAGLRAHVRYPEMLLALQADVYGLYHMTNPQVFYNREDLWTVATDVAAGDRSAEQAAQPMEPNFVLMKLPGETTTEFVEMLPFTPANRNNLIGWIAGRSDARALRRRRSSTTFRRRGWWTGRCRSRRGSTRTRSCRASCRCGTSRARACGAARCW